MERSEPWLAESAIWFIENYLIPNDEAPLLRKVFEFGSGSSTKWLIDRCEELISVEHDSNWFDNVYDGIRNDILVGRLKYGLYNRSYDHVINQFVGSYFDLILIDGRDRVKCIQSSIPKLKSGGWLVLDNSEREYYQRGIDLMKDWNRIDCKQIRPDKYGFTYPDWTTSIFIKP